MGRRRVEFSRNWLETVAVRGRDADPDFLPTGRMVNRWLNFAGLPSRLSWFIPEDADWNDLNVRLDVAHAILSLIAPCVMDYDGVGPFMAWHVARFAEAMSHSGHDFVLRSCSLFKEGHEYAVTVSLLDRDVGRPLSAVTRWTVAHGLAMRHAPLLERQLSGYDMEGAESVPVKNNQQQ